MRGYPTSLNELFTGNDDRPTINAIEIPIIQRDFAHGRDTGRAPEIRKNFLDVLCGSLTGGQPVGLDFIYGEITVDGKFLPLDGQQRLTNLFLLHWYLAFRRGVLDQQHPWTRFSYATRPSADLFCRRLTHFAPPTDVDDPAAWLEDQRWFNHSWSADPTIQSMLTVIRAIDDRLASADYEAAWARLTDPAMPAISFQLLPLDDISGDTLYIKMNSRGKPLTDFENFKARFEKTLGEANPTRAKEFAHRIDGMWADLLWPYHGGDFIVDDEFMRYFEFITEICEWREDRIESGPLEERTRTIFGKENPRHDDHIDFLFAAFDGWSGRNPEDAFADWLRAPGEVGPETTSVLFGQNVNVNLFEACCHTFGDTRGRGRVFAFGQSLMLYAALIHLDEKTDDFATRLRVLRNLVAGSEDDVRLDNMPKLLREVEGLIRTGSLEGLNTFRGVQVNDEVRKRDFLTTHPDLTPALQQLEDSTILRGTLISIDLEHHPERLADRAATFLELFEAPGLWGKVTAALLAEGEYQRKWFSAPAVRFGTATSNESIWRELFTVSTFEATEPTRNVLMSFLDRLAAGSGPITARLDGAVSDFLAAREVAKIFDWRYHLVKYPEMREGDSAIFYFSGSDRLDYEIAMMYKTRLYSNYRDAFLYAVWRASHVGEAVEDPWFTGWSTQERWMKVAHSGTQIRCTNDGFLVRAPEDDAFHATVAEVCAQNGMTGPADRSLLPIPQAERDGLAVDTEDRVVRGAQLLRDLVEAGL